MNDAFDTHHKVVKVSVSEFLTTYSSEITTDGAGTFTSITIAPATGNKLSVYSAFVSTDAAAGFFNIDFLTSSKPIYRSYMAKETAPRTSVMHINGANDEVITISGSGLGATKKVFVIINYAEEKGE